MANGERSQKIASELVEWLKDYSHSRINSRVIDERRTIPPYILTDFGLKGIMGMTVPESYGGTDLSTRDFLKVQTQLAAIDLTLSLFVSIHNVLGARPIALYGSNQTKEEFLEKLATGRMMAGTGITEPQAGSHVIGISSRGTQAPDGSWKLNGEKNWIGLASWAGVINVFARLVHPSGHEELAGFVVRQSAPGLRMGKEALTLGMRGVVQCAFSMHDVTVTEKDRLGEGISGLKVMGDLLGYGRLTIAAMSRGSIQRCLHIAHRYSSRRQIAGGAIFDRPHWREFFSGGLTMVKSLDRLLEVVCSRLEAGLEVEEELSLFGKSFGSEFLWEAVDSCMQILGGRGYIESNGVPQIMRDARVLRIFEGPTEGLHSYMGSKVIRTEGRVISKILLGLGAHNLSDEFTARMQGFFDDYKRVYGVSLSDENSIMKLEIPIAEMAGLYIFRALVQGSDLESAWFGARIERKFLEIQQKISGKILIHNEQSIHQAIKSFGESIGDHVQTLPGALEEMDPYLLP